MNAWNPVDLRQLERLPHITVIDPMLIQLQDLFSIASSHASRICFPPQLQSVHLCVAFCLSDDDDEDEADQAFQAVLDSLSACNSLTEVKLTAITESIPWDLTPLLEFKQLRRLAIKGWPETHYGVLQMAVVKRIATLQSLELLPYDGYEDEDIFVPPSWLAALCQPPHQLQQLEDLNLSRVWLFQTDQLQHLPALTTLEPAFLSISALAGLASFPHLRRLRLALEASLDGDLGELVAEDMLDDRGYARASLFLPHLRCTGLQKLEVRECVFSKEEALALCRLLPQLTELSLADVDWPSLEPLCHLTQLTSLSLDVARLAPLGLSIQHLQPLQQLQSLTLEQIYPPLDAATVAALQPPSALMPSLTSFNH